MVRPDGSSEISYFDCPECVVIYPAEVDSAVYITDQPHLGASNTTIRSPIYKGL